MLSGRELDHLVATLNRAGFDISVSQRADLFDLCLGEALRLDTPDRLDRAAYLIAPIICHRADDQQRFYQLYENWAALARTMPSAPVRTTPRPTAPAPKDRPIPAAVTWVFGCLAATLTVAMVLTFFDPAPPEPAPTRSASRSSLLLGPGRPADYRPVQLPSEGGLGSLRLLGLFVPLAVFAFWLHWRSTRRKAVAGRLRNQDRSAAHWLRPRQGGLPALLDPHLVKQTAGFKTWEPGSRSAFDIDASVNATSAAGGRVVLVQQQRPVPREYVALVQSYGPEDHAARMARSFIQLLQHDEIKVHCFDFDVDSSTVLAEKSSTRSDRQGLSLVDLRKRYPNAPILVFADSTAFFAQGQLKPWVSLLTETRACFALNYREETNWGAREHALWAAGISVLPMSLRGLLAIPRLLAQGDHRSPQRAGANRPATSDPIASTANQHKDSEAPASPDETDALQRFIQHHPDPDLLLWLAACAVYPGLRWEITLALGTTLTNDRGHRLFSEPRLRTLVCMPWFRNAQIPQQQRVALVDSLSNSQRTRIRRVVHGLLDEALGGTGPSLNSGGSNSGGLNAGGFNSGAAALSPVQGSPVQVPGISSGLSREGLVEDYVSTSPAGSPPRDPVFTSVLFGRGPRQRLLQWSDRLARVLGFGVDLVPMVGVLIAILGMLAFDLIAGALDALAPALGPWVRDNEVVVLMTIYISFVMSWCAFWTSLAMNSRFAVRFDEFRRPRYH